MKSLYLFLFLAASGFSSAEVRFNVDVSAQVDGNRLFRHVPSVWPAGKFINEPPLKGDWLQKRQEGTIWTPTDWFGLSNPTAEFPLWKKDDAGNIVFDPNPATEELIQSWVMETGLKPLVVVGTPTIPAPLVEGGSATGQFGFQVRQPNDYVKWGIYLDSLFQWLISKYGREEIRQWGFLYGIEADWQSKAVYPGTNDVMNPEDNRNEFLKMVDHFHAALERNIGPGVYLGVYGAFEQQSKFFIEHWAKGKNYATGKVGTRIAFTGFSDWTVMDYVETFNPLSRAGEKVRAQQPDTFTAAASIAAGFVWKYDHVSTWAEPHPSLRGMEINIPEAGYFDTKGGINAGGEIVPADYLPADHRGAALYAMRLIGYSRCPRLTWVWNRYALGTGDILNYFPDTAKAPVFHAQRISAKLHGQRLLAVEQPTQAEQDVENVALMATASKDGSGDFTILAANLGPVAGERKAEDVIIHVIGLEAQEELTVNISQIDEQHNNWWPEWTRYREKNEIPFVAGPNRGHLGANVLYKAEYLKNTNDVIGTMRPEDQGKWLAKVPEYSGINLEVTMPGMKVPIRDGKAVIPLQLPSNGVALLEIRLGRSPRSIPLSADATAIKTLPISAKLVEKVIPLSGLKPGGAYTAVLEAKSTARVTDYEASLQRLDRSGKVVGWGDYSGDWNSIQLTSQADSNGSLELAFRVPAQLGEANDAVQFRLTRVLEH